MDNWYVWLAGLILPTLIVAAIKQDAFRHFQVPPQLGKRAALVITIGLSVVLGFITRPAKHDIHDAVHAGGNMFDTLSSRQSDIQNNVDYADRIANGL